MARVFKLTATVTVYGDPSKDLGELLAAAGQDVLETAWPSFGVGDVKVAEVEKIEKLRPAEPDPRD